MRVRRGNTVADRRSMQVKITVLAVSCNGVQHVKIRLADRVGRIRPEPTVSMTARAAPRPTISMLRQSGHDIIIPSVRVSPRAWPGPSRRAPAPSSSTAPVILLEAPIRERIGRPLASDYSNSGVSRWCLDPLSGLRGMCGCRLPPAWNRCGPLWIVYTCSYIRLMLFRIYLIKRNILSSTLTCQRASFKIRHR